jgi:hypothetical protein
MGKNILGFRGQNQNSTTKLKAIRIIFDASEEAELNMIRGKKNDSGNEKALMILLNAGGLRQQARTG